VREEEWKRKQDLVYLKKKQDLVEVSTHDQSLHRKAAAHLLNMVKQHTIWNDAPRHKLRIES
jgi:hypothetical protein